MRFVCLAAPALAFAPPTAEHRGPPTRPPWRKDFGDYCFRASCEVARQGKHAGRVVGYDRYMTIAEDVQRACSRVARDGEECGTAAVTLLTASRKECAGQVFFIDPEGTVRRV